MHIVEEHRQPNMIRFVVFFALTVVLAWGLAFYPQSVSSGLWMPVLLVLFFAITVFSFQSIFYRREIWIRDGRVEVLVKQFLKANEVWEIPLSSYERLSLRWYFPSRFFVPSQLRLILEHNDPSKTLVLIEGGARGDIEQLRVKARNLHLELGTREFFDESERVEA